jgi:hypothetical protein
MSEVYKVRDTKLGREVAVVGGNVPLEIPEHQKEFNRIHVRLL